MLPPSGMTTMYIGRLRYYSALQRASTIVIVNPIGTSSDKNTFSHVFTLEFLLANPTRTIKAYPYSKSSQIGIRITNILRDMSPSSFAQKRYINPPFHRAKMMKLGMSPQLIFLLRLT